MPAVSETDLEQNITGFRKGQVVLVTVTPVGPEEMSLMMEK